MKPVLEPRMLRIFPGKCLGCGARMERGSLCDSCSAEFVRATGELCVDCGLPFRECRCVPARIKSGRVRAFLKLYNYDPSESETSTAHMIYLLKRGRSRRVIAFLADKLCEALTEADLRGDGWCVSYVPRSRRAIAKYGYDHMKRLAREVADRLGIPCESLLVHVGSREQKKLGAVGRAFAAANAYRIKPEVEVKGRRIILLDDVLTTGATLSNCTRLLARAEATRLLCAVVAETRRGAALTLK